MPDRGRVEHLAGCCGLHDSAPYMTTSACGRAADARGGPPDPNPRPPPRRRQARPGDVKGGERCVVLSISREIKVLNLAQISCKS